ncbi:hypothetical protein NDI43_18865 [Microcoleus vaginatus GB2-A3]|uniref:hypothetical protein n=1 Tax=Microcoleus vaginatus TaxID=119532 RepID=UPI0032AE2BA3
MGILFRLFPKKLDETCALFYALPEMDKVPDFIKIVKQIINRWRSIFVSQELSITVISCKLILFGSCWLLNDMYVRSNNRNQIAW